MSWTIKGESGKTLDATVRTLESILGTNARLVLSSLEADTFEWESATTDAAGAGTIIPDAGQIIEVFYSGTRRFYGNVTIPRVSTRRVTVRAEGAWWWMNRIGLTEDQVDDEATTATRPSYVFPTQSLKTSLESLIDRAIANGVPMIRGTVATMFYFPRVTLTEKSCAQALADLMSICPDAVVYFDYSGATGSYPILNITRRGVMSAETLTLGTDAVEDIDIYPRLDLEVAQVKIGSMTRNATTGANQWAAQTSGTATAGKNQIMVVSGPEVNDIMPKDNFDQFDCQSVAMPTSGFIAGNVSGTSAAVSPVTYSASIADFYQFILNNDTEMIRLKQKAPSLSPRVVLGGRHVFSIYGNGNGGAGIITGRPELFSKAPISGLYVVTSKDQVPEWAKSQNGWTVESGTLDYWTMLYSVTETEPYWYDTVAVDMGATRFQGYYSPTYASKMYAAYWKGSMPVQIISAAYASLTTVYRAWDYDYIQPPAGLAAALLAAQNWVPWEGSIQTVADTVDGAQDLLKKYNVDGTLTACSTMAALPRSITYDIARGRKTIRLGAPARTDFGSLASRFRRSPKDNIVYL